MTARPLAPITGQQKPLMADGFDRVQAFDVSFTGCFGRKCTIVVLMRSCLVKRSFLFARSLGAVTMFFSVFEVHMCIPEGLGGALHTIIYV